MKLSRIKTAHTSNQKKGMGDYYGTGIKQKLAINRDLKIANSVSKPKLKKPPKSLA
jgi:hypothetical protein